MVDWVPWASADILVCLNQSDWTDANASHRHHRAAYVDVTATDVRVMVKNEIPELDVGLQNTRTN